jgi:hypothetical protein
MYPVVITRLAGEDLTGYQNKTVKFTTHEVHKSTADYDAQGVLVTDGISGAPVSVCMFGPCKGVLGEACVEGDQLHAESDGVFELYDAGGDHLAAIALQEGSSGDTIDIMFLGYMDATYPHA